MAGAEEIDQSQVSTDSLKEGLVIKTIILLYLDHKVLDSNEHTRTHRSHDRAPYIVQRLLPSHRVVQ